MYKRIYVIILDIIFNKIIIFISRISVLILDSIMKTISCVKIFDIINEHN